VGELDLSFLWRRKWWIAASVAAALVACLVADLVIPPRYRAAAQILIGPVDLRDMMVARPGRVVLHDHRGAGMTPHATTAGILIACRSYSPPVWRVHRSGGEHRRSLNN
jgi:hypothetical protein